ncbi:MAG: 50S ribosomal protein L23 [Gammaproteobacteria bacterium]|nr:50S ribosomal protein L23 [Gammaproteobacteria bacterium]
MNQERLMKIILAPLISEKSTELADKRKQFVFKVVIDALKPEIKKAIETLFNVKVKSVGIVRSQGKVKRFKQILGQRKRWKKAYVALEKGYDIDFSQGLKEE